MTNAEIIIDYASSRDGVIVRREFMSWFLAGHPNGSVRSMDTELRLLVLDGILQRTGNGRFRLSPDIKPPYIPVISQEMRGLFAGISELYPYADFCIWQVRALSTFMQHVPSVDVVILETDRSAAEAVFEDIREISTGRTVLLRPTEKEYRLYASGSPSLIVRDRVSEAPVIDVADVTTASLEKILVDATIAPEFEFARGAEIYTIYENANEMYRLNKKTMLRYASRRGKKDEIAELIESTMI